MGGVYRARQRRLGRLTALKVISPACLPHPSSVARFHQEAAAAALLSHDNIVRVYDAGEDRGQHYLAMEYLDGTDLYRLLAGEGPLPASLACEYIRQAAVGLQHAH